MILRGDTPSTLLEIVCFKLTACCHVQNIPKLLQAAKSNDVYSFWSRHRIFCGSDMGQQAHKLATHFYVITYVEQQARHRHMLATKSADSHGTCRLSCHRIFRQHEIRLHVLGWFERCVCFRCAARGSPHMNYTHALEIFSMYCCHMKWGTARHMTYEHVGDG